LVLLASIDVMRRENAHEEARGFPPEGCGSAIRNPTSTIRHPTSEIRNPKSEIPVTQSLVSRFAGTDENMTSQVIRSLADRGLVARSEHPTDARARCLSLTPAGEELLARARALVLPARDRFFAPLGSRSAELAALLREVVDAQDG